MTTAPTRAACAAASPGPARSCPRQAPRRCRRWRGRAASGRLSRRNASSFRELSLTPSSSLIRGFPRPRFLPISTDLLARPFRRFAETPHDSRYPDRSPRVESLIAVGGGDEAAGLDRGLDTPRRVPQARKHCAPPVGRFGAAVLAVGLLVLAVSAAQPSRVPAHADHPGATLPVTRAPGLRLDLVGTFSTPTYVTSAPGDPSRLFIRREARDDSRRQGRRARAAAVPRHPRSRSLDETGRGGPPVGGLRPRLPEDGPALHRVCAERSRRSPRRGEALAIEPLALDPETRARDRALEHRGSLRRPAPLRTRRVPVLERGRRRSAAGRSRQRAEPRRVAREDPAHRPAATGLGAPVRHPA